MKTRRSLLVLLLLLLAAPALSADGDGLRLTILYTNDTHASFEPRQTEEGALEGGIVALDAEVRRVRAAESRVLLLDAGDALSGHPISVTSYEGVAGGAVFHMMSLVGYDAMALGNHDLDNGQEALAGLVKMARHPVLCANAGRADGSPVVPGILPHKIFEVGGVRVGVFGLILEELAEVTGRDNTVGLQVLSPIAVAREMVAALDPKTDLIVALTHQGTDLDVKLAEAVPGIDVVIGGHNHRRLERPRKVGGVLVCQAEARLGLLGRLDLVVKDDAVVSHENALLRLPHVPEKAAPALVEFVDGQKRQLDGQLQVKIGELRSPWRRNYHGESSLGNYVAAAFAEAAGAEIGFVNSGSLRKDLDPGPVTIKDVWEILPFENRLGRFTATGKQLREICRHNAWAAATKDHGILQVSGLAYSWRETKPGEVEILSVTVKGKEVDPDAEYRVGAADFILYDQAEKYFGFTPTKRENLNLPIQEVLIAAVRKHGTVDVATDQRIRRVR